MKLGAQLSICWIIAVSVGGAYAGVTIFSGGSEQNFEIAAQY